MNASQNQPYQSQSGSANVDAASSRLDMLLREYPDQYAVINTGKPVSQQAIFLVSRDIATEIARDANRDSNTQAYIAVKASDLVVRS